MLKSSAQVRRAWRRHVPLATVVAIGLGATAVATVLHHPAAVAGLGAALTLAAARSFAGASHRRAAAMRLALGMSRRLADNGERFAALVEESPHCTLICDGTLVLSYASAPLRELLGRRPDAAFGTSLLAWLEPEDLPSLHDAIALSAAAGGGAVPLLLLLRHADGQARWIETTLRDLRTRASVRGIVLNCVDVGERVQARDEAARAEERLAIALDGARIALWDADLTSGAVHLSSQWAQLVGVADGPTQTTLVDLAQRVHVDDAAALQRAWLRVSDGPGDDLRADMRVRCDDGRWLWVEVVGRVVERDVDGRARRIAGVNVDASVRHQAQAQLADLSLHDALTDLPNRALLADRVTQAIAQAERHQESVALLVIDLDRFSHVNEAHGHEAGDALLCEVADRLRVPLRHGQTLARLGGDRFAVALPALASSEQAASAAQALLDALQGEPLRIAVSAGVGIAMCPLDGQDAGALLRSADIALAQAKATGPGQIQFCDPQTSARARRRIALERELAGAVARGEMRLAYLPLFEGAGQRILGAEALLRWTHPLLGEVAPTEFIPIAEASGAIVALGRWALDGACTQARAWQVGAAPGFRIAINVSPVQLRDDPGLVAAVCAAFERSGLAPGTLELEVTESEFAADDGIALATLLRLQRDAGARLAIDDFGIGHSSFARLRRLPVDKVKIDRSFVQGIPADAGDAAIVQALLAVGRALDIEVTVEGVESEAQLAMLAAMGCTQVQGHGLAAPMSAEALSARLERAAERATA